MLYSALAISVSFFQEAILSVAKITVYWRSLSWALSLKSLEALAFSCFIPFYLWQKKI